MHFGCFQLKIAYYSLEATDNKNETGSQTEHNSSQVLCIVQLMSYFY